MSEYRRTDIPGGTYFFTVKTFNRRPLLIEAPYRTALRQAIIDVRSKLPFKSIAWVLLPDHLHTIWRLPEADANFSLRWALIEQHVTGRALAEAAMYQQLHQDKDEVKERFGSGGFGNTQFVTRPTFDIMSTTFTTIRLSTVMFQALRLGHTRLFIDTSTMAYIQWIGHLATVTPSQITENKLVRKRTLQVFTPK